MSGLKANWFTPVIEEDTEDPFAAPIEEVGVPIDLSDETARLNRKLVELVDAESRLEAAGVTCDIRDRPDTACNACPVTLHNEEGDAGRLCRVARAQEVVLTTLAARGLGRE